MPLKTIIIDDEPFVRKDLSNMLLPYKDLEVSSQAGSIREAKKQLAENQFDLIFLDVCLPGGTGFELLPFINKSSKVVFVTGHDKYAIKAFEINALDYLLKPVSTDRLSKTLGRVFPEPDKPITKRSDKPILVKGNSGEHYLNPEEILAISSLGGNYIAVTLKDKEQILCRKTLKEWESQLPESSFFRIHRSTIINTKLIQRMVRQKGGAFQVFLFNQEKPFSVSRRMTTRLKEAIKKRDVRG